MPHCTKYPTRAKLPPPTASSVVTLTALLAPETLSKVSRALTVNVYVVIGVRPLTVVLVPVTSFGVAPARSTWYPAIGKVVGAGAVQARLTVVVVRPVERRFVGALGGVSAPPSHRLPLIRQLAGVPGPEATNDRLYGSVVRPAATVPL